MRTQRRGVLCTSLSGSISRIVWRHRNAIVLVVTARLQVWANPARLAADVVDRLRFEIAILRSNIAAEKVDRSFDAKQRHRPVTRKKVRAPSAQYPFCPKVASGLPATIESRGSQ